MKSLKISELLLLSELERSARRVPFDPERTIVLGKNDTGKSSIVKSIYQTFGARPAEVHPHWEQAEVTSVVKFALDDEAYTILKRGDLYAVFDASARLLGRFTKITSGLGPFLADLFAFRLTLTSRDKQLITPPPAYFFLPYYIDQDAGWNANWSSFARLNQLARWRTPVVEYHTGIKPNEYYVAKSDLEIAEDKLRREDSETEILRDVRTRMQRETGVATFDVSLEDFREQLEELLVRCQTLLELEEELKAQLRELNNTGVLIDTQANVVRRALAEASRDYEYAATVLVHDSVDCPTCGATYENSFAERFAIARDEDRLTEMLLQLEAERRELDEQIRGVQKRFDDSRDEVRDVQSLLATTRSQVSLSMVLQSEGRKEVDAVFLGKLKEAEARRSVIQQDADRHKERLKALDDRERKREIHEHYRGLMRSYLHTLNVTRLAENSYKRITASIRESGSDKPRALLAYFFSILHVMRAQDSTTTFCPIVIDSPNQQAQDQLNLPVMLEFIRDNTPRNAQLVLALEDLYGVDFPSTVVRLEQRDKVLNDHEYASVREQIMPFLTKVLSPNDERV